MGSSQGRESGTVRRWAAAALVGGSTFLSAGCSLIPTWDDVRTTTTTVKDHLTGKARQDALNKQYAEARLLERRKDYAGAESMYRDLLKSEPKSRDCYHRLGVIAAQQQKYDDAHRNYQIALQCSTPTPDLWSDIGYCFYLQNKLPEAEQSLRQALELQPQHGAALNNLALVVGEQGRIEEAYDLFRKANGEAEAEQNVGFLCAACGELERAQGHFSRALSINPDLRPAAEALIQVTQAMQRRNDALAEQNLVAQSGGVPQADAAGGVVTAQGTAQVTAQGTAQGAVQPYGPANQPGAVQQASAQSPADAVQPRRLMEVFTGGPRSAAAHAQVAARSHAAADMSASQAPTGGVPTGGVPAASLAPGAGAQSTPQFNPSGGFSYPAMPQPQYLQPMNTPPSQVMGEMSRNAAAGAAPAPAPTPAPANNFPGFVGGAQR